MRDELGMPIPQKVGTWQEIYDATPELVSRGEWVCLNIQPDADWPVRAQHLDFDGHRIWIIPVTTDCYPGVAMKCPQGLSRHEAECILYRLLSVIAWREECGIAVAHRSGGSLPHMMGMERKGVFKIRPDFDFTDIICPQDEDQRIALALMREARSLNHYGYAFLSYWRILELAFPNKQDRIFWMNTAIPALKGWGVPEAVASINSNGVTDVGWHLFKSGRCAIAHAAGRPIINPDDPRDAERLFRELPLVREMAICAIEERFSIDTPSTEYRQHLYELRGWKGIIGQELIGRILVGDDPKEGELIELPTINFRLRDCAPYLPFEGMVATYAAAHERTLHVEYRTPDHLLAIRFRLDFAEERLTFDVAKGLYLHDDGSVVAAEYQREILRFIRDYFLNGVLQIWDADSGMLLSRKDAFIPVNCMIALDVCNTQIAEAKAEVERRQSELPEEV